MTSTKERYQKHQNGFQKGRACTDASFTVKLFMEKRIEHNLEMQGCFIDLEKAYDYVNRIKLFEILEQYGLPGKLIQVIKNLYKSTKIQIRIDEETSECAEINKGVRQGSLLSCTLFNLYMDKIIRE